jgi:hypothetical protein
MASYEIYLRSAAGNLLTVISGFERLEYARAEQEVGVLTLDLPRSDTERLLSKDVRLEIWRTVGTKTYLEGSTCWFLRKWTLTRSGGVQTWRLQAYDGNYLLGGREVEYAAGSSQAQKTDAIDDLMKAIVRENLGASATDGDRDISTYLACQVDLGLAPSTTKAFSRRNVLKVLQELAEESYQRGTYLAFDTQYLSASQLEFRTFTGALGMDHGRESGSTIVVNEARGSLVDAKLEWDYSLEVTAATAGGQGQEAARAIYTAVDARASETPFSRRELFVHATQAGTSAAALEAEARAALNEGRPTVVLTGKIQDTTGLTYGIDYQYGDRVVAEHEGYSFDAHVNTIHVTVSKEGEEVDNQIRGAL